jgi:hypothetical protein
MANRNRTAGIKAEQKIAKELRELGFDGVVTTRAESKNLDDKGIDLTQIMGSKKILPCHIQIKKTVQTPKISELITTLDKPLIVIHIKEEKKGSRFYEVGEYVYMDKEFFYKLLQKWLH